MFRNFHVHENLFIIAYVFTYTQPLAEIPQSHNSYSVKITLNNYGCKRLMRFFSNFERTSKKYRGYTKNIPLLLYVTNTNHTEASESDGIFIFRFSQ